MKTKKDASERKGRGRRTRVENGRQESRANLMGIDTSSLRPSVLSSIAPRALLNARSPQQTRRGLSLSPFAAFGFAGSAYPLVRCTLRNEYLPHSYSSSEAFSACCLEMTHRGLLPPPRTRSTISSLNCFPRLPPTATNSRMSFFASSANPVLKTLVPVVVSPDGAHKEQEAHSSRRGNRRAHYLSFLPSVSHLSFLQALTFGVQTGFAIPAIIYQTEKYYDVRSPSPRSSECSARLGSPRELN
jgi:hypothetical protein